MARFARPIGGDVGQAYKSVSSGISGAQLVGYPAKGTAIAITGLLLGLAAARQPPCGGGLDKALRTLAGQLYGTLALLVVAVGLAAFGVYCFASARARKF